MKIEDWYGLGLQLGLPVAGGLRDIAANHRGDIATCRREMFRLWLPTANYYQLKRALHAMNEDFLAESLVGFFDSTGEPLAEGMGLGLCCSGVTSGGLESSFISSSGSFVCL